MQKEYVPLTEQEYSHLCEGIPVLEFSESDLLSRASRLVAVKDRLDELAHSQGGSRILEALGLETGFNRTVGTWTFVFDVLPFFDAHRRIMSRRPGDAPPTYKALVPTYMVVGDSWNWQPVHKAAELQDQIIRVSFRALAESEPTRAHGACADYQYIKSLGLVFAHEGKNRVALFKERKLPYIPAVVSEEDYPAAERLRIFDLPNACIAVLDNRYVEHVKFPALVNDLLQAYGVAIENKWPDNFPELEHVLAKLDKSLLRDQVDAQSIDLENIALDEKAENTEVDTCLMEIESVVLPNTKLMLWAVGTLLVLLASIGVTSQWPNLRTVLAYAAGAINVLLVVPVLPIVKCKVKHLKSNHRGGHFQSIRQRLLRGQ
jgi:hypothetical protein